MAILEATPGQQHASQFIAQPHRLLIDGDWVESASGQTFATLNPATEEVLGQVAWGTSEDIDRAVRAARRAFDEETKSVVTRLG